MNSNNRPPRLDFSTIIASSVHDMKNSLQLLLGTLDEVIDDRPGDAQPDAKILRAQAEGRRINDQLIQLLTLYKSGNTQHNLQSEEHSVREFLDELYLDNHVILAQRGIQLNVACDKTLQWFFDRELLKSVINNLITNAQQYTNDKIRLSAAIKEKRLFISVDDNGPGYPEAMLRNYRAEDGLTPGNNSAATGGTGLGLFFSATIAHMHKNRTQHGFLQTSNEGIEGGARCTIILP